MSSHRTKILLLAATLVAPTLTSCKRGPTREQREIMEHFDKPKREEEALKRNIQEYFKDTPYTFEVSYMLESGDLKNGTTTAEELKRLRFTLFIYCSGPLTKEDGKIINLGLRKTLSKDQYETAKIYYQVESWNDEKTYTRWRFPEVDEVEVPPTSPSFPTPSESLPSWATPRPE